MITAVTIYKDRLPHAGVKVPETATSALLLLTLDLPAHLCPWGARHSLLPKSDGFVQTHPSHPFLQRSPCICLGFVHEAPDASCPDIPQVGGPAVGVGDLNSQVSQCSLVSASLLWSPVRGFDKTGDIHLKMCRKVAFVFERERKR